MNNIDIISSINYNAGNILDQAKKAAPQQQPLEDIADTTIKADNAAAINAALQILRKSRLVDGYFLGEIEEPTPLNEAIVFPNPVLAGQDLVIEIFDPEGKFNLEIFNALGQRVHHETFNNDSAGRFLRVPTSTLAKGIYMLHVKGNTIDQVMQFVVHSK